MQICDIQYCDYVPCVYCVVTSWQFEDMKVDFHMERLSVAIKDSKDKNEIIRLTVEELKSTLTQRPGAQAIKFVSPFYAWRALSQGCLCLNCI